MQIIRPELIDDSNLVSSNVAETVPVWSNTTTYALGAHVRVDSTHHVYESLLAGNVGKNPADAANQPPSPGASWLDIGATNKWAMFDQFNQTQTVNAGSIEIEIQAVGRITGMAFLNLGAASIDILMTDGVEGVIYDETISLVDNQNISNWYDYFFEPIILRTDVVVLDLPVHYGPLINVSINAPSGTAKIGNFVMGSMRKIGDTLYGPTIGIIDHSRKEVDDFGGVTLIERSYRKTGTFRVTVPNNLADEVHRILTDYRATPIVYVGTGLYSASVYYGFYRDFGVSLEYYQSATLDINIEGLT